MKANSIFRTAMVLFLAMFTTTVWADVNFGNVFEKEGTEVVNYTKGQQATIILPVTPDADKGKYYRLDRVEDYQIVFEEEPHPQARVPYIIIPNEDFSIDVSTLDLTGIWRDSTNIYGVSFIGTYVKDVIGYKDSYYYYTIDATSDCLNDMNRYNVYVGAMRAFLQVDWRKHNNQWEKMQFMIHDSGSEPKESHYYYYNGKKIPLTLNENKVIVSIPKECEDTSKRICANVSLLNTIQDKIFDIFIIPQLDFERLTSQNFWEEDAKSMVLTSSYYTEDNKEVYETPYLNVKLKKEEDANLLDSYAEKYKLKNLGSFSQNLPLWYILHVTPDSDKSPLECANELYESGFFASSVPDFASDNVIEGTYRPLVEEGKHWTYDNYMPLRPAEYDHYYYYDLKGDTLIAGQQCLKMYSDNRANDNAIRYEGALYEVNKKVYCFYPNKDEAELLYDFDCKVGDTLHIDGRRLLVKDIRTEDDGGITIKKYTLQIVWNYEEEYVVWIEGVGAMKDFFGMVPASGNYNSLNACELNGEKLYQMVVQDPTEEGYHKMGIEGKRWNYVHYHMEDDGWHEEPYSYVVKGDTVIRRTTYKKLYYQDEKTERLECLLLEIGRTVYKNNSSNSELLTTLFDFGRDDFGRVFTWKAESIPGNTNWMVYGVDTIEVNNCQFRRYTCLQKYSEDDETLTTIEYGGEGVWNDIWVEGVGSATSGIEDQYPFHEPYLRTPGEYTAFVSCYEDGKCIFTKEDFYKESSGAETAQDDYRQFVEDGKVWMVRVFSDSSSYPDGRPNSQWTEYYYFAEDTVINNQTAKRMMCVTNANYENWENGVFTPRNLPQDYVGAWYEQDKKVYFVGNRQKQFELLYDFTLETGNTIQTPYGEELLVKKLSGGIQGFKGSYYDFGYVMSYCHWLEGVGSESYPYINYPWAFSGQVGVLLACRVGEEIIYYNSEEGDPFGMGAKKRRFDFTHTVKIQPKTPQRRGEETALYGEYNDQSLDIRLDPLDEAYSVCITNQKTGETLYEKAVNAGSIVALNIDISKYPEGQYKISIDNSNETFNGVFDTSATEISEIINGKWSNSKSIYNLQGQRIKTLQKGLNIVDGRKIWVR